MRWQTLLSDRGPPAGNDDDLTIKRIGCSADTEAAYARSSFSAAATAFGSVIMA
jgi:hypothetical protein